MHPTGHTSDTFKFHLRKLVKLGYVAKQDDGAYALTPRGKEYANGLNTQLRTTQKQPKLSVLIVATKKTGRDEAQYLVQKRQRNPFFGYWGEIHGRAEWGETFEETASRQLKRQAGLDATFTVKGFRRIRDYDGVSNEMLEDKVFVIVEAANINGVLSNRYDGGENAWMTIDELKAQDKVFASTLSVIQSHGDTDFYQAQDLVYNPGDY